jgi:hypothetical protein
MPELEQACDALLVVIQDGDFDKKKIEYIRLQSTIKFRQLNI